MSVAWVEPKTPDCVIDLDEDVTNPDLMLDDTSILKVQINVTATVTNLVIPELPAGSYVIINNNHIILGMTIQTPTTLNNNGAYKDLIREAPVIINEHRGAAKVVSVNINQQNIATWTFDRPLNTEAGLTGNGGALQVSKDGGSWLGAYTWELTTPTTISVSYSSSDDHGNVWRILSSKDTANVMIPFEVGQTGEL